MEKAYKAWQDAKSENIKPGDSETVKKLLTEKQTIEENINIADQKLEAEQLVLTLINGKRSHRRRQSIISFTRNGRAALLRRLPVSDGGATLRPRPTRQLPAARG